MTTARFQIPRALPRPSFRKVESRLALAVLLGASVVLGLAGCGSSAKRDSAWGVAEDNTWFDAFPKVYADPLINNSLTYSRPNERRSATDTLQVTMPIRWTRASSYPIEYRFVFLDESNLPEQEQPAWRTVFLRSQMPAYVSGNSRNPSAVDWTLEIRSAPTAPGTIRNATAGSSGRAGTRRAK